MVDKKKIKTYKMPTEQRVRLLEAMADSLGTKTTGVPISDWESMCAWAALVLTAKAMLDLVNEGKVNVKWSREDNEPIFWVDGVQVDDEDTTDSDD